ncbi:MAG: carbohydrate binding family 9 domain-containing protein [Ignavibacteria bacterium]|nr:carbohydrate binding family 9 domain-containing protein [Ignavibacteria bacterium]
MSGRTLFLLIFVTLFPAFTYAQEESDTSSNFTPNIKPELNIPRLAAENIKIDGDLSEYVWEKAAVISNFTEISPGDNVKPEVETEGRVFYDEEYLYFGFTAYETDMKSLRASMSDRDRMYADDWIGAFIDTYGGLKQGFEMYCNPKSIQGDLLWTTNNEDSNFDIIYDSEAKIFKDKWTAEFRIPFKSLRFPETKEQNWRIHIIRNRPRGARQEIYWASVSRDDPNFMGQSGFLKGIKDVERGKDIQFLPYILGTQGSSLDDPSDPDSEFKHDKVQGQLGINASREASFLSRRETEFFHTSQCSLHSLSQQSTRCT